MILCYIFQYYVDCYDTDKIGTKYRTGGISQWISWIRGVIHEPKNISPSQNNSSEHLDKLRTRRPLPRIICGGQTYNYVQIVVLTDPKRNKRVGDVVIFHEWTLGFHIKMILRQGIQGKTNAILDVRSRVQREFSIPGILVRFSFIFLHISWTALSHFWKNIRW